MIGTIYPKDLNEKNKVDKPDCYNALAERHGVTIISIYHNKSVF